MGKSTFSVKTKKMITICMLVFLILFSIAVYFAIGRPLIRFVSKPEEFRAFVKSYGVWSRLAFIGMVVFQVIVAIVPGEPFELGAGYAFGILEGTLWSMLGILLGSAVIFALVRKFGVKILDIFFSKDSIQSVKFLKKTKKLFLVTFLVFFIPGTPKDLLSYGIGLTKMKFWHWMLIVGVARFPSIISSTICGAALGQQNYWVAAIVFIVTGVLSGISLLIYRQISMRKQ